MILSAGAIGSPQLLLLSGIGAAEELRAAGVAPRHELPGVGRNLQDHPFVTVIWEVSDQDTLYGADKPKPLAEWLLRRSGKLSSTVAEVCAFTRTRGRACPPPTSSSTWAPPTSKTTAPRNTTGHCAVIAPTLVSPKARGQVWLRSADPNDEAAHHHQHAVRARRRRVDGRGHRAGAARSPRSSPLREVVVKELKPGPGSRRTARTSKPTCAAG